MILQFTTKLSTVIGLPEDQVRIMTLLILSIPLSYVLYLVRNKNFRFYYSLIVGTILQVIMYHQDYVQYFLIFLQTVAVYYVCKFYRKNCGLIVTVQSIGMMSALHIYRQITHGGKYDGTWKLDSTAIFMILVCKYCQFAYAYQDGASDKKLSAEQQLYKIQQLPSLGDYFGYIQFLPTSVLGPPFEYKQYQKYINCDYHIPSPVMQVLKTMLYCLVLFGIYLVSLFYFDTYFMTSQQFLTWSPWAMYFYSGVSIGLATSKYFFGWKLVSGALHACGITYSPKNNNFQQIPTCNPEIIFTTLHLREMLANWNMGVQRWLRTCIYLRYGSEELYKVDKSAQWKGQLLVFMVSAFWHGFFAGYYITFFMWFVFTHLSAQIFKITRNYPVVEIYYKKSGIVGCVLLHLIINSTILHLSSYFLLIELGYCLAVLKRLYYLPPTLVIIVTIILQVSGLHKQKTKRS